MKQCLPLYPYTAHILEMSGTVVESLRGGQASLPRLLIDKGPETLLRHVDVM
jgi:hypothetical protein